MKWKRKKRKTKKKSPIQANQCFQCGFTFLIAFRRLSFYLFIFLTLWYGGPWPKIIINLIQTSWTRYRVSQNAFCNYNRIEWKPVQIFNKFAPTCASICSQMIDVLFFFWQCSKCSHRQQQQFFDASMSYLGSFNVIIICLVLFTAFIPFFFRLFFTFFALVENCETHWNSYVIITHPTEWIAFISAEKNEKK